MAIIATTTTMTTVVVVVRVRTGGNIAMTTRYFVDPGAYYLAEDGTMTAMMASPLRMRRCDADEREQRRPLHCQLFKVYVSTTQIFCLCVCQSYLLSTNLAHHKTSFTDQ
jgi:hypothetical protein